MLGLPNAREGQALALRCRRCYLQHAREGQALALRHRKPLFHRRAGACPPPCLGSPNAREGQALALRVGRHAWLARDRFSRYGIGNRSCLVGWGPVPRHAWVHRTLARDRPSRYGLGGTLGSRAGLGFPNDREGQALALRNRRCDLLAVWHKHLTRNFLDK